MTEVYVTVEEAVAQILKFDYVLDGIDLFETLYAFLQDAQNEYEEAKCEPLLVDELGAYKLRVGVCESRCEQAESLRELLTKEIANPGYSMLNLDSEQKLERDSVAYWAAVTFGVELIDPIEETPVTLDVEVGNTGPVSTERCEEYFWKDVEIRIYESYKLRYKIGKNACKHSHFRDFDFMGKCKNSPNDLGGILIGLSQGHKFPTGIKRTANDSVPLSKIRASLKKHIGLNSEPFHPFNESDGWKPIFKLVDARGAADKRAKDKAQHESYNDGNEYATEARGFDSEGDPAGEWLSENS